MKILHWFLKTYPDLVKEMKSVTHHVDDETFSVYHAEGDIFTHTMIVYNLLQRESTELKLTALLHDIGKVSTRHVKPLKSSASFTFHENVSMFEAIKILEQFQKDFPEENIDPVKIVKAIGWHQLLHKIGEFNEEKEFSLPEEDRQWLNHFFGNDLEFYEFMVKFGRADGQGRICEDMDFLDRRYEFLDVFIPEEMYHIKDGKPLAYILSGPQCSGKSTYAKELMKTGDFVYLSSDDILTKGGTLDYNMAYSKDAAFEADKTLFEKLKEAVALRKNIIVDQTNTDPVGRARKASIIPDKYYHKIAINFVSDPDRIKDRNLKRKKEGKYMDYSFIEAKIIQFELAGTDLFHESLTIIT
jgi:predicted kinase